MVEEILVVTQKPRCDLSPGILFQERITLIRVECLSPPNVLVHFPLL